MDHQAPGARPGVVRLRPVEDADLPIFYEHQRDAEAARMAAFGSRDAPTFMAHWARIRADDTILLRTILVDGQVAGNIVSWVQMGEQEVGYWLGREYWGRGVATRALAAFLEEITTRPLFARVAKHNVASRRVLEKCGFTVIAEEEIFADEQGNPIPEFVLVLRGPEGNATS
jgi:RimJ/RimL family protein N-acetyltransferase